MSITPIPKTWGWKLRRDGNMWRATGPDDLDPVRSPVGFGATKAEAVAALAHLRADVPDVARFQVFPDVSWIETEGGFLVEEP